MSQVFCHSGYNRYVLYKCVKYFVIQCITGMFSINVSSVCHSVYNRYVPYKCVKCFVIQCITGMFCIIVSNVFWHSVYNWAGLGLGGVIITNYQSIRSINTNDCSNQSQA